MQSAQAGHPAAPPLRTGTIAALGLAGVGLYCGALVLVMSRTSYDIWPSMIVVPVLFGLTLPAFAREAKRQGDSKIFTFLVVALLVKFAFTIVRYYFAFKSGSADAAVYHRYGLTLSELWRDGNFSLELPRIEGKLGPIDDLSGTGFVRFFTGLVYMLIGPTKSGGFFFFSWLSFLGYFFFYRAFITAVPEGSARTYGRYLFFFPSLLYWPSSIGKEAFMIFTLGIAAYGVARILRGNFATGIAIAGAAMWLGGIVRAHVPAMLVLGLVAAYAVRRSKPGLLGPLGKAVILAVLVAGASFLVVKTEQFLNADLGSSDAVASTLEQTSERSAHGGSEFEPVIVRSPAQLPLAFATVLFRPFPHEAHSAEALASALEGMLLLGLSLVRFRWLVASLKSVRRRPYVVIAIVYTLIFVVAFASFPNFGLLARQRVQLLPLYFVLFAIPPLASSIKNRRGHELNSAKDR